MAKDIKGLTPQVIIWSGSTPGDDASMQTIDNSARTTKTQFAKGIGNCAYWPGSSNSAGNSAASSGEMLLGAHRFHRLHSAIYDTFAGGSPNGYLGLFSALASGTAPKTPESNVYLQHTGSENTHMLGGTGTEEVIAAFLGSDQVRSFQTRERWVVDEGEFSVTDADLGANAINQAVTFNVTYGAPPWVFLSTNSAGGTRGVDLVTTTGFTSRFSSIVAGAGEPGTVVFQWRSEGTIAYD